MLVLEAALKYASLGWRVFPLRGTEGQEKLPIFKGTFDISSSDPSQLHKWWGSYPNRGIGIDCGGSGLVVLDCDVRNGYEEALEYAEQTYGKLPEGPYQITPSGGRHYFFRAPEGYRFVQVVRTSMVPRHEFEIKHNGRYVVGWPTAIRGRTYEWEFWSSPFEDAIPALPDKWVRGLADKSKERKIVEVRGELAESFAMGVCKALGLHIGKPASNGGVCVECPWKGEHSSRSGEGHDSGTVILPPVCEGGAGVFHCSHAACASRKIADVARLLTEEQSVEVHKNAAWSYWLGIYSGGKIEW